LLWPSSPKVLLSPARQQVLIVQQQQLRLHAWCLPCNNCCCPYVTCAPG
jgi:hypothetical protein